MDDGSDADLLDSGEDISNSKSPVAQTRKLEDSDVDKLEHVPNKIPRLSANENVGDDILEENFDLNDISKQQNNTAELTENDVSQELDTTNEYEEDDVKNEEYEVISDSDEDSDDDNLDLEGEEEYSDGSDVVSVGEDTMNDIDFGLEHIRSCQKELESLNQKANMEILCVEQKFNKLRKPIFDKRNSLITKVPNFWSSTIIQHPQLKRVMTPEDVKCLKYLNQLIIQDFKNDKSTGYKMKFIFNKNSWFEDSCIIKEYRLPWHGLSSCTCTPITWKPNMNLTTRDSSFFCWFTSQKDTSADDIAEIIKEDIWLDPLRSFYGFNNKNSIPGTSKGIDNSVVVLDETLGEDDDEEIEYISSEDEEWEESEQNVGTDEENVNLEDIQNSVEGQKVDVSEDSLLNDDEEDDGEAMLEGEDLESDDEYVDGTIDLEKDSDDEDTNLNATETSIEHDEESKDNLDTSEEDRLQNFQQSEENSLDVNGVSEIGNNLEENGVDLPLSLPLSVESNENSNDKLGDSGNPIKSQTKSSENSNDSNIHQADIDG